jgi:hypothetical protein
MIISTLAMTCCLYDCCVYIVKLLGKKGITKNLLSVSNWFMTVIATTKP